MTSRTNLPASPWSGATIDLPAPLAVVDLDAFDANGADLRRRASGTPIRVATKSIRVPELIRRALAGDGFHGVMTFSVPEAAWLVNAGITEDALMGYPTVDPASIALLAGDERLRGAITLMVDSTDHLDQLTAAHRQGSAPFSVCIDVDASLRIGPLHLGVRRSPLRTPLAAAELANEAVRRGINVRGLMFYEAQVAGLGEVGLQAPIIRAIKRASLRELATRRQEIINIVQSVVGHDLLVNGGGSGSVAETAAASGITEVTAGSGFFVPTLFDHYSSFTPRPAAFFGLDIVRHPAPGIATAFGGGYIASGPAGQSRVPLPMAGKYVGTEGAGEVQTPLQFPRGREPKIGDRVWFRHAKAGELMEHFFHVHLVAPSQGGAVETVRTYRGEGFAFG